jgi:hypothetical protein
MQGWFLIWFFHRYVGWVARARWINWYGQWWVFRTTLNLVYKLIYYAVFSSSFLAFTSLHDEVCFLKFRLWSVGDYRILVCFEWLLFWTNRCIRFLGFNVKTTDVYSCNVLLSFLKCLIVFVHFHVIMEILGTAEIQFCYQSITLMYIYPLCIGFLLITGWLIDLCFLWFRQVYVLSHLFPGIYLSSRSPHNWWVGSSSCLPQELSC